MTGAAEPFYASHLDFYRQVYSHALRDVRPAGRTGAAMFTAEQTAGDWSDAASPDLVIGLLLKGQVEATIDVGAGQFRKSQTALGDIVVIPPHVGTTFLIGGDHRTCGLAMPYAQLLDLAGDGSGLPPDGDFGRLHSGMLRDHILQDMVERLWREGASGSVHGSLWADGMLLQIVARLLYLAEPQARPAKGGLAPWQLRRLTDYLVAHLDQELSLSDLSRLVGLSAAHLSREFKASTGASPWRWLAERKIERAKALLSDPKLTLTEVAQMVGYAGQSTFGEAFRRGTGMTPGQYRREIGH